MSTNWILKLAAFLHDPPEKAYDFGVQHTARARHHADSLKVPGHIWEGKDADWSSSAADRFIFPSAKSVSARLDGFTHPFSGKRLEKTKMPDQETAEKVFDSIRPDYAAEFAVQERFWLVWRLWRDRAAELAPMLPYLPADTRIPDHTIWQHCAIASALDVARKADNSLHPAFFLFQVGPVQDFIGQARSTRDCWSGSYLLAWLMAHAIGCVADKLGPDNIIFPSLRGLPIFDWMNQAVLKKALYSSKDGQESYNYWEDVLKGGKKEFQERLLCPNLPNRFLAIVPDDFKGDAVKDAFLEEWRKIADKCLQALNASPHLFSEKALARWKFQVENFWSVSWQLWPWLDADQTLKLAAKCPIVHADKIKLSRDIAANIPKDEKDERCYKDGKLNAGWYWPLHYGLCQHRLDARRNTRDFTAWQAQATEKAVKDDYSGREETIIDEEWLQQIAGHQKLKYLFRHKREHLGAPNLIKRVWHEVYLAEEQEIARIKKSFDSVPAIAAAPWVDRVSNQIRGNEQVWGALLDFQEKLRACADWLEFPLPGDAQEIRWLEKIDAAVFQDSFWNQIMAESNNDQNVAEAQKALQDLISAAKVGKPSVYYAVLALDGDHIGKWLSGEKAPPIKDVVVENAAQYFCDKVKLKEAGQTVNDWLVSPRPLSPSFHLQFSEALSNFALYCAQRIVESHHGQLIYAGGDDVLAMLPADEAIACARGLRAAFRGDLDDQGHSVLASLYKNMFADTDSGFVKLKVPEAMCRSAEPWPLMVPGPKATVSVGIAIGHVREPLQDMIEAAQSAERRAKDKKKLDRDALAVTLFKRSGETVEWGVNFDSKAFDLLAFFKENYRAPIDDPKKIMPISGRFPYRVAALLRAYCVGADNKLVERNDRLPVVDQALRKIAEAELQWIIRQQCEEPVRAELFRLSQEYLAELEAKKRLLSDFWSLFAVEAFIARQGE